MKEGGLPGKMIKELRERTGVSMTKCKEALVRAEGDMDMAIEILRKEGIVSAIKKEGREAREGTIAVGETNITISLLEIDCETDFVAKNKEFREFAFHSAHQAAEKKPDTLELFLEESYLKDPDVTVEQKRNLLVQKIGENIQIRRLEIIRREESSSYGIYSHMGGKIVGIVEIEGSDLEGELARDIAMHIVAEDPEYLSIEDIPEEVREKEKEIAESQIKDKPEQVVKKIVEGKLKVFEERVCLLLQKFVKDISLTIQELVEKREKEIGKKLKGTRFWRWKVGQE